MQPRSNSHSKAIINNGNVIPSFASGTDETTDIIFGGGDLEGDFVGNGNVGLSLCGTKSDGCLARDLDLDLERDLELHFDLNLDLIGDRDRDRRSLSLERRFRSEERRRAGYG